MPQGHDLIPCRSLGKYAKEVKPCTLQGIDLTHVLLMKATGKDTPKKHIKQVNLVQNLLKLLGFGVILVQNPVKC